MSRSLVGVHLMNLSLKSVGYWVLVLTLLRYMLVGKARFGPPGNSNSKTLETLAYRRGKLSLFITSE